MAILPGGILLFICNCWYTSWYFTSPVEIPGGANICGVNIHVCPGHKPGTPSIIASVVSQVMLYCCVAISPVDMLYHSLLSPVDTL